MIQFPNNEKIVNENKIIFISVISHCTVVKPGKKEKSSDKEEIGGIDILKL